jgi:iron(II)-dependent oxidoreductase
MDIFISYSKKDHDQAYKLVDDLTKAGFDVWIDRSLEVGDEWEAMIETQLQQAQDVIVILSENSLNSRWVQHEGSMAYALKKNILPIAINEIKPEELPIWAGKIQYQKFFDVERPLVLQNLINKLTPVNHLRKLLIKQHEIYIQTKVLPSQEFLRSVEYALKECPVQSMELASFLFLAALKNELHIDFWVDLALRNGVDIFSALNEHLEESEFHFRKSAIQALRIAATPERADIFLRFLEDPYPQVRKEAIRAMWKFPELRSKLLDMLIYERYIPSGSFKMGMDEIPALEDSGRPLTEFDKQGFSEYPAHDVFTDAYFIDAYPVTNQDYLRFLMDTKPEALKTGKFISEIKGREQVAVTNLDWDEAYEYARWAGKRLPTEAEWEKAARGPQAFLFPWGNYFDIAKAHTLESRVRVLKSVDSYCPLGDSPFGVASMVGNVWEWISDWYHDNYYRSEKSFENPVGPRQGNQKVLRGGSYKETVQNANAYRRIGCLPTRKGTDIGFRCAFVVGDVQ